MTKYKTVTMSRDLAERISARLERLNAGFCELRALLAALVVERQEPVAWQYRVSAGPATGWSLWHDGKGEEFRNSYQVETRALYTSPPAPVAVVPEGWKLVPIEPTDDMIVAFAEAWYSKRQTIDDPDMLDAYRDMLAVAPACELNQ